MVCGWQRPQALRGAGTQVRAEVTRERPAARAAAPPRPPHHAASPSPTARTLLQTPLTPLKDLTGVQTPPPPRPRCATPGRSPTVPEPQLHPEAPTTWGGVGPRTHGRPGPTNLGHGPLPRENGPRPAALSAAPGPRTPRKPAHPLQTGPMGHKLTIPPPRSGTSGPLLKCSATPPTATQRFLRPAPPGALTAPDAHWRRLRHAQKGAVSGQRSRPGPLPARQLGRAPAYTRTTSPTIPRCAICACAARIHAASRPGRAESAKQAEVAFGTAAGTLPCDGSVVHGALGAAGLAAPLGLEAKEPELLASSAPPPGAGSEGGTQATAAWARLPQLGHPERHVGAEQGAIPSL